jgi:hypothetical protein
MKTWLVRVGVGVVALAAIWATDAVISRNHASGPHRSTAVTMPPLAPPRIPPSAIKAAKPKRVERPRPQAQRPRSSARNPAQHQRSDSASRGYCYPATKLPAVHLAAVHLPATTLPATTFNGHRYPAQRIPAVDIPAQTIPAQTIERTCIRSSEFAPIHTTVKVDGYKELDPSYSARLTSDYWADTGSASEMPNPTASGFGELNAAGFPKNQYVRSYFRKDGTHVDGYWRNSPSDGLPTCQIISC